jgi:hypothetical protein
MLQFRKVPRRTDQAKVRFGIMCNSMILRRFQLDSLLRILALPGVEPALVIVDGNNSNPLSFSGKVKAISGVRNTLWPIFRRATRLDQTGLLERVDASHELAYLPRIQCRTFKKGKYSEYFEPQDIREITDYNLDFILKFAFGIIRGDILTSARYGVWSYHHDDPDRYRGIPPAFWEVYHGDPATGAVLQRLTEKLDGGIILRKCIVQTARYSYKINLARILAASSHMPASVCKDILSGHSAYLDVAPSQTKAPICKDPTNRQLLLFLLRCGNAWVRDQIEGLLFSEGWKVGVVRAPIQRFLDPDFRPDIHWLPFDRPKEFIADPFFETSGPAMSILAERYDYDGKRGYIVRVQLDTNGEPRLETILETAGHLSYPYLLRHNGVKYVIPESSSAREVALYRIEEPGGRMTRVLTLVKNFAAVDATVIQHADRWWMFATDVEGPTDANLHVWHAPELYGPWEAHALNPVKVDVRSSRPAGTPFYHEGSLYRPAQNCSIRYGGSTTINRILRLTPTEFAEEPVRELRHDDNSRYSGFHTLSAGDGWTVVDGRCDEVNATLIWRKLTYKIGKALGRSRTPPPAVITEQADVATPDR